MGDGLQNFNYAPVNFLVGEPQKPDTKPTDISLPALVCCFWPIKEMAILVYFDSQLKDGTIKVDHKRAGAVLSAKAQAEQLIPQTFAQTTASGLGIDFRSWSRLCLSEDLLKTRGILISPTTSLARSGSDLPHDRKHPSPLTKGKLSEGASYSPKLLSSGRRTMICWATL